MLRHAFACTLNMPSQDNFWEAVSGVSPTSDGGSSEALWTQVLCDSEPKGGRARRLNSDVGTQSLSPYVCAHVCALQKMCHSDLSILFNEMAGEGLLWLPGVGVTFE